MAVEVQKVVKVEVQKVEKAALVADVDNKPYKIGKGKPPLEYTWRKGQPHPRGGHKKGQKNIVQRVRRTIAKQLEENGNFEAPEVIKKLIGEFFKDVDINKLSSDDATWIRVRIAALNGEQWAASFIADRLEGMARQRVELSFTDLKEAADEVGKIIVEFVPANKVDECLLKLNAVLAKANG